MISLKSKLANMLLNLASMRRRWCLEADSARHREAALQGAHGEGHHNVDDDVDQRCRGKRLEHLKGKFLHGAGAGGQFHETDGERYRAVLDGVEQFGGK